MKRSNRLILLIGVFLAVVAFVGIAVLLGPGSKPAETKVTELPTVIAAQDIPLGVRVASEMLKVEPRKLDGARKADAFQGVDLVVGQIARRPIAKDAQLEAADFDTSAIGLSQIDTPKGMRAMAVSIDQVSGVGTIINRGDYVDMLVAFTGDKFPVVTLNPADDSITVVAGVNSTSTKLLLEGMQVLGRLLPTPEATNTQGEGGGTEPGTTLTGQQAIVILAVTPAQAEVIKFSQVDGNISLVLRSPLDFVDAEGNPIPAPPAGTQGVTLKKLTVDLAVPIPELVEALIPSQR